MNQLDADQLYPDDGYGYVPASPGGGYFNPMEAMTSSPRTSSPFRTLPRGGPPNTVAASFGMMYSANNPLKEYGYPSDYGLPLTSMTSNGGYPNPLSDLYEENIEAMNAIGQNQYPQPQHCSASKLMNLSNSSGSSTLSPPRGQLSSSGIGDISTASGTADQELRPAKDSFKNDDAC
jgi:hypothetical protein